jgi:dipeptidyl aminopeptidase/acylaminoacyl peptidase
MNVERIADFSMNPVASTVLAAPCIALASAALFAQPPGRQQLAGASSITSSVPVVRVLPSARDSNAVACTVYAPEPSKGEKAGLVIHLYGRGGSHTDFNLRNPAYDELRRLLVQRGYFIVVPELGTDHWMNDKAVRSLDAIVAGMVEAGAVDSARVHILGTSMGGCSGLAYIIRRPGVIRSICALFPITDAAAWMKERPDYAASIAAGHGVAADRLAPVLKQLSAMQHINAFARVPVFLLHGDADSCVPVHHSRDFFAALRARGARVVYREVTGGGHDDGIAARHQTEMADFLTQACPARH